MKVMRADNFIAGELRSPRSGQYLDSISPIDGAVIGQVARSSGGDVADAVFAAKKAFPKWQALSIEERSEALLEVAKLIDAHAEELAQLECIDNGKPITQCRNIDIPRAAENFRFFAKFMLCEKDDAYWRDSSEHLHLSRRQALGVVGVISPWNLPLYLLTWKIAPALAAGNAVVAKPSEVTSLTAARFAELCSESSLPKGLINIVFGLGNEAGAAMCSDPGIKALSFTGSTRAGREISLAAASSFKKLSLEMGGKNAAIVCDDCDLEHTLDHLVRSSFSNQGQICLCSSRILVHESLYARFKEGFLERVRELKLGDPRKEDTQVGALVSREHFEKVSGFFEEIKKTGGALLCGGPSSELCQSLGGFYFEPAVFEGLANDSLCNQEEIFGPLVGLQSFSNDSEAVSLCNDSRYGLSATVWSQNLNRIFDLSKKIDVGLVWANDWMPRDLRVPFGGFKESGVGREGGSRALSFFSEEKSICVRVKGVS